MESLENFKIKGKNITKEEKEFLVSKGYSYCQRCSSVKIISEFSKDKNNRYGFSSKCKECERKRAEERRKDFPEKVKESRRKHKNTKKEYYNAQKREWDYSNRPHINKYKRGKYNNDPKYKTQIICRLLVRKMFQSIKQDKVFKTSDILGYTSLELKEHIEKQFKEGMSWDNHGEWHVDHIRPISLATNLKEGIELSQLENLQPLWAEENLAKQNKII